jgi:hypothetical protein
LSFRVQEELRYGTTCGGRNNPERQMKNLHSNKPAPGKAGTASLFAIEHLCPGLPEPGR